MRRTLQKIIRTLDGQPTGGKGQSLVEMTVTFPLLIFIFLGLTEIAFAANNYLIIMDAVREGGRRGANLNVTFWNDADTRNTQRLDCDSSPNVFNINNDQNRGVPRGPTGPYGYYTATTDGSLGYFDSVVCQVLLSMAPLEFEDSRPWTGPGGTTPPSPDRSNLFTKNDLIVSVFSYSLMQYPTNFVGNPPGGSLGPKVPPNRVWLTVTGRWPLANRYCRTADGQGDERDPFDYKRNGYYSLWTDGPPADVHELGHPTNPTAILGPSGSQKIRGFVFTGAAIGTDGATDDCLGSKFTVQEVEARLNNAYNVAELSNFAPNGGMIIVEMFFQHHPVIFGPIFQGVNGDPVNDPVFYVYSIFPSPAAKATSTPE